LLDFLIIIFVIVEPKPVGHLATDTDASFELEFIEAASWDENELNVVLLMDVPWDVDDGVIINDFE
jgi:hypothetical protein